MIGIIKIAISFACHLESKIHFNHIEYVNMGNPFLGIKHPLRKICSIWCDRTRL